VGRARRRDRARRGRHADARRCAGGDEGGRIGLSEEIAATVAFLACDDASYSTGQSVEVNGGMHM
jgi:NAD(P)-dependent dehydrogenase (short-subunit alcohol dehydrogenase family)